MEHATEIHIGARKQRQGGINEDSATTAVLENHHRDTEHPVGVFVLADGVGGAAGGDVASFLATSVVRKRLVEALTGPATDRPESVGVEGFADPPTVGERPDDTEAWLRETIQDAVDEAHEAIQDYAKESGGRPATTVVVGVYLDDTIHYAWAGDSRLYLVNTAHEEIQQLTEDHAVTDKLLEEGEIEHEEYARVHPDTTAITNAVGGSPYGEPSVDLEFDTADVYAEDRILLTSDGLVDAFPNIGPLRDDYERADDKESVRETIRETLVTDDEIRDVVLDAADLQTAAEDLIDFANDRGGKDNLSITLARDPTAPESPTVLPKRGASTSEPLADRETVIETAGDDTGNGTGEADAPADDPEDPAASESPPDEPADDPDPESVASEPPPASGSVDAVPGPGDEAAESDEGHADTADDHDESPAADADEVPDGPLDVVSLSDRGADVGDDPTAAVAIEGHGRLYEVADGFTVGRGVEGAEDNPNLGLVLEDEAVEAHHARFERDGVAGYWRVQDCSDVGTWVRADDGEWHRLHAGNDRESHRLTDGTPLTLQPPDEDPVTVHFFTSVERAQRIVQQGGGEDGEDDDGLLDKFR